MLRSAVVVILLTFLIPPAMGGLEAQRPPPVHVQGIVIDDSTGEPIPGAHVLVLNSFGDRVATRMANEFGHFDVELRRTSGIRLRASRIGYREATSPVLHFDGRLHFEIELRLDAEAVLLAPLEVVARSEVARSPVFSNFDQRAQSGFGSYFTRDDIERIRPGQVSDLLQHVPGVRLEGSGHGNSRAIVMARSQGDPGPGGGGCIVQIFVDGRLMNRGQARDIAVDDLVTPRDVEGVEVYRGASTVPPEFLNPEARCGVVAIWTRRAG